MKKWIRLTIEILLGATVVGSGTFIYLQMAEIGELEAKVAKLATSPVKRPSSDSSLSPIRLEQLIAKEKELEAVKSALSNGLALSDVENAAKNAKKESPERYLAIGALRLLVKGKEDPETAKAFEKALEKYNNRVHGITKMTPFERWNREEVILKATEFLLEQDKPPKFQVGVFVRVLDIHNFV